MTLAIFAVSAVTLAALGIGAWGVRVARTTSDLFVASRAVSPMAASRSRPSGGMPSVVRRAVSACTATIETWWATTSCSSRAMRARSWAAA